MIPRRTLEKEREEQYVYIERKSGKGDPGNT